MIYHIIISALSIVFIHSLFWDGMLLAPIRRKYLSRLPLFIRKPLFECLPCMTSIHGVLCYGAGSFFFEIGWMGLLPFLFAVGGLLILIRPVIGHAEDLFGEDYVLRAQGQRVIVEWTDDVVKTKRNPSVIKPTRKKKK